MPFNGLSFLFCAFCGILFVRAVRSCGFNAYYQFERKKDMRKIIFVILASAMIATAVFSSLLTVGAETGEKDKFVSDFTSSDGWTGDTEYINQEKGFGSNDGWAETSKKITTKEVFDFGSKFDASFDMYTEYGNGNQINACEDYYLFIGDFKIALCDYQTRIKIYYKDTDIGGLSLCSDMQYRSPVTYHYNVHIEPGNISVTSPIITYTSDFSDFEPADGAAVSVQKHETWQIYTAYINNLSIWTEKNSFAADFSSADSWTGLTEYIDTENGYFGTSLEWNNKQGSIVSADLYYFGSTVDAGFSIFTDYANSAYYDKSGLKESYSDYSVSIGDFEIVVCDYQTRIKIKYNGTEIEGESVCSDYTYRTAVTRNYEVHIEPGYITVVSENVSFFSDYADFGEIDGAAIALKIYETWQIAAFRIFDVSASAANDEFLAGDIDGDGNVNAEDLVCMREYILEPTGTISRFDVNRDGSADIRDLIRLKKILTELSYTTLPDSFTADFSSVDGWDGDTSNINTEKQFYGSTSGWENAVGTITSKTRLNLGTAFKAEFGLYTDWANGSPVSDHFDIAIGGFTVKIGAFQNKMSLYYGNTELAETASGSYSYDCTKNYTYSLYVTPGNISLVQRNSQGKPILWLSSEFSAYQELKNITVSLTNSETWEIYSGYIHSLEIASVTPNSIYLSDNFDSADNWNGDTGFIGEYNTTETGFGESKGWSDSFRTITSKENYDLGDTFDASFKLFTDYSNGGKINANEDFKITIGDFVVSVCNFQTRVKVYYNGTDIGGISDCESTYVSPRARNYNVHIEPGNIKITSETLTYTSDFSGFAPQNNVSVSLKKNTTWEIWTIFIDDFTVSKNSESVLHTVAAAEGISGGTVTPAADSAAAGETVTVYVQPGINRQLKPGSLKYTYNESGILKEEQITQAQSANIYTFVMPDADAELFAEFEEAGTFSMALVSASLDNEDPAVAAGFNVAGVLNNGAGVSECGFVYGSGTSVKASSSCTLANGMTEFTAEIPVADWSENITVRPYAVKDSEKIYGSEATFSLNSIAGFFTDAFVVSSYIGNINGEEVIIHNGEPYLTNGVQAQMSRVLEKNPETAAEYAEYAEPIFATAKELEYNTLVLSVPWKCFEKAENVYDYDIIRYICGYADEYDIDIQLLWFGSDVCGDKSFAPSYILNDTEKYSRLASDGSLLDYSDKNLIYCEKKAYSEFLKALFRYDTGKKVVAIQIENELNTSKNGSAWVGGQF